MVFLRYPEPGKVKSRLAVGIGGHEAAGIYEKLTRRILGLAADLKRLVPELKVYLCFDPPEKRTEMQTRYPGDWEFVPQEGAHLGERMDRALRFAMSRGNRQVLLVGTDLLDLEVHDFLEAFEALEQGLAPLGPAADGGFYLIGLDRPCSSALGPSEWGTDAVFRRTESLLRQSGLGVKRLKERRDIDRPEDLGLLRKKPLLGSSLSVIVPTLGAFESLRPLLSHLAARLWPGDEVVLACGGRQMSPDDNGRFGQRVRWIGSARGRGIQLNAGARAARGDLLLFLHDDCLPPDHFAYSARKIAEAPDMSLGCFQLAFAPSNRALDLISGWANVRSRRFKLPYGDQGLFCRREVFERLQGFRKPYLMEDVDFVERSRSLGHLMVLPETVYTSPQRYLQRGILRASMENHLFMLLYRLGVADRRLYSLYYG